MHIDMDAFFAAVEQHDFPAYRGKPVIVGGDPRSRGVVSTCSYEARKFGIHSAMPLQEAFRRCPHGIFLPPRGARYTEVSREIMNILNDYTPQVEPLSLDEAFLDLTGSERVFGPTEEIARRIVNRIETELGLTASVGLASNKFLAKLASDLRKPKGFVIVNRENMRTILDDLPVDKIWGVGPKTAAELKGLGIDTIGVLSRVDPGLLQRKFGKAGPELYQLAHGIDNRLVASGDAAKSIGHEITFQEDTGDWQFLAGVLLWLSDQVARALRRTECQGRVITIKIRDNDFKTITRQVTLPQPTDYEELIYRESLRLAEAAAWGGKKVRLVGVSISGFTGETNTQLNLFEVITPEESPELKKLHQAVDALRDRFGEGVITKGTIIRVKEEMKESFCRRTGDKNPLDKQKKQ